MTNFVPKRYHSVIMNFRVSNLVVISESLETNLSFLKTVELILTKFSENVQITLLIIWIFYLMNILKNLTYMIF